MKGKFFFDCGFDFFEKFNCFQEGKSRQRPGKFLGNITIEDGKTCHDDMSILNGNIVVGANCKVTGKCSTVNGNIEIGTNSKVEELDTVNGNIVIGEKSVTAQDIRSINGSLKTGKGVEIKGDIRVINGSIQLIDSIVKEDIRTYSADISLAGSTMIKGYILVTGDAVFFLHHHNNRTLTVEIKDDTVVKGCIIVKDPHAEVKVILSGNGKVEGEIIDAEVIQQ